VALMAADGVREVISSDVLPADITVHRLHTKLR
jgi:hypothetical protein